MRFSLLLLIATACGGDDMGREWPGRGPNPGGRRAPPGAGVGPAAAVGSIPDELEVAFGQWGVDIDESLSVKLTGERSIWFKATSAPLALVWHDVDHQAPVQAGRRYKAWFVFQADQNAGGQSADSYIQWMAADRITMIAETQVRQAPVTAVNVWQRAELVAEAPAGAFYARLRFGRVGAGFNVYFDEADMKPAVPLVQAHQTVATSIPNTGQFTIVVFNVVEEAADVSFNTTTGRATIVVPGFYLVNARTSIGPLGGSALVVGALYVNGVVERLGTRIREGAADEPMAGVFGALVQLNAGDIVDFRVAHDDTAARDTLGSDAGTYFSCIRIM